MASKIKTSLAKNTNIEFDSKPQSPNILSIEQNKTNVDSQNKSSGSSQTSNLNSGLNKSTSSVEEISYEDLNLPFFKSIEKKAVDCLSALNLNNINEDMIESVDGNKIRLKNGTIITLYSNLLNAKNHTFEFNTIPYEFQAGIIQDINGNQFIFDENGVQEANIKDSKAYKIGNHIDWNEDIHSILLQSFKNVENKQEYAFIKKIENNYSLYEKALNQILEKYKGNEEQFVKDFGFSMYTLDPDGSVHFNYETLAVYLGKTLWNDYYGYKDINEVNKAQLQLRPESGNQLFRIMNDGSIGINNTNYPIVSISEWDREIDNFSDLDVKKYGVGNNLLIGQCTWFASRRYHQTHGVVPVTNGNATDWIYNANQNSVGSVPKKHSVMVLGGTEYGHVAFVEDVKYDAAGNVTSITISEANVNGDPNNVESTVARAEQLTRVNTYSSVQEYANLVKMPVKGFIY